MELCESRGGRPGLSVLTNLLVSVDVKLGIIEPCFGIGLSLFLICQLTSEDIKHHFIIMVSVGRFGLAVRRYAGTEAGGPRFESASALLSLQKLWSVDTVLSVTLSLTTVLIKH